MQTLKGRTCVFAGATGQIGRGAVRALAEGGMNVVMLTHMLADATDVSNALRNCPGEVIFQSNEMSEEEIYAFAADRFGSIDVFVSSTGGLNAVLPLSQLSRNDLEKKLVHQVAEPFASIQRLLPYLERSNAPRIILTASSGAQDGFCGENILDSIARGGVISMTYALARELSNRRITVNCIARSGMINDHAPSGAQDHDIASIAASIPIGHIGTREEYGALVAYLASEEAGFITGQVINLSGGLKIGS